VPSHGHDAHAGVSTIVVGRAILLVAANGMPLADSDLGSVPLLARTTIGCCLGEYFFDDRSHASR